MKLKLLATVLLGMPLLATSQVSLNSSMAPAINSVFIYYDANVPSPAFTFGKTGTSNTWDFSSITPVSGAEDTTYVVAPSSIPNGNAFPTATHVTYEDGDPSYTMMRIDATGIYYLGSVSDLTGTGNLMAVPMSTPLLAMPFPYVYGISGTGTSFFELYSDGASVGQPSMDSIRYKMTITGQRDVIAGGNMIIPSGTFPAILERSIDNSVDTLWMKGSLTGGQWVIAPNFPQTNTDSSFRWYTNNSLQPYAHALYDNTGLHDVNYFKNMTTGITAPVAGSNGSVYPNPVTNVLNVNLPAKTGRSFDLKIFNTQGREIMNGSTSLSSINVSTLNAGIYFLHLTGVDGKVSVTKFVKD